MGRSGIFSGFQPLSFAGKKETVSLLTVPEMIVKRLVATCHSFGFLLLLFFVHDTGRNRRDTLLLNG
jgi:hypothetical protein